MKKNNAESNASVDKSFDADNNIKEIKPKKKHRSKRNILIYLAIIGFVFYAVITIINQSLKTAELEYELQDLKQQISVVEIQTQYLDKVQSYKGKEREEYISKIAKEELGYISNGERIFINVAGD